MSSTFIAPTHDANCPLSPLYRAVVSPYQQAGTGHSLETNCICNARRVAAYASAGQGVFVAPMSTYVPSSSYPRPMYAYQAPTQPTPPYTTQVLPSSPPIILTAENRSRTPIPPRRHSDRQFSHDIVFAPGTARRSSNIRPGVAGSTYQEPARAVVVQGVSQPALTPVTVGTQQPLARQVQALPPSMYQAPGQDRR